jgi:hypothetical protein
MCTKFRSLVFALTDVTEQVRTLSKADRLHSRGACHGSLGRDSLHEAISSSRPRPLPCAHIPVVITYHNKMRHC